MFYQLKLKRVEAQQLVGNSAEWHRIYSWVEHENVIHFEDVEFGQKFKNDWSLRDGLNIAIDPTDGSIVVPAPGGIYYAGHRDWIVKFSDGNFGVYTEEEFAAVFEPEGE